MKTLLKPALFITVAALISACATVPITGRHQLSLVKNEEILPLSFQNYQQVLKKGPLSTDEKEVALIRKVGTRIQHAVEEYMQENGYADQLKGFKWDFNLIDNDTIVNAWCMPGGKVAFYTGILPICKDENGIAVVMGHEVAHAIANHSRERMSQQMAVNGIFSIGAAAVGSTAGVMDDIFLRAAGAGTQVGMLKFSREHESEADHMGLIFMAMGGYDPAEAPKFWIRMQKDSGGEQPPQWLSTHPSHENRVKNLKKWLPEAQKYYHPTN